MVAPAAPAPRGRSGRGAAASPAAAAVPVSPSLSPPLAPCPPRRLPAPSAAPPLPRPPLARVSGKLRSIPGSLHPCSLQPRSRLPRQVPGPSGTSGNSQCFHQ
ncbi:unnamed protein product [Coccothraustes coccothraustes]